MNLLLILNDGPYGTERSYNGLRLALSLAKTEGTTVRVFLMADAVACANLIYAGTRSSVCFSDRFSSRRWPRLFC